MSKLDGILQPQDIKKLNIKELNELSQEIRAEILSVTEKNGGHLASNLGIVETTIALHYVFDFPKDKLLLDVGHQCYAHKILTGRKDRFSTIRTDGGLSGFIDSSESEYDCFSSGHAGTSVAASIGFCTARDKLLQDYKVIGLMGDGAIANGLNLEAITANEFKPKNLIIILNDNGMSISKNGNGFYRFISRHTTKKAYVKSKRAIKKIFRDSFITRMLSGFRDFIKRVLNKSNYFEQYGFKYVGVVDGNNIQDLVKIFERVKEISKDRAVFLHLKTTKGKGYKSAEENSELYHGVGEKHKTDNGDFSLALGKKLNQLIDSDDRIVAITAGMKDGTGLSLVEKQHPDNFIDVGIAEEYAVTLSAGMASGGLKPIVGIYSTFMQRAYDQILHDVCLQNLPVIFCIDRAGVVGKDGKTHQGVFDISYLSHIPNINIFAPTTTAEFEHTLEYALTLNAPVAIRYPKDSVGERKVKPFSDGLWETIKEGDDLVILAVGPRMVKIATEFADKKNGVSVVSARSIKPLCIKTLDEIKNKVIITLEENSILGGFGSLVDLYYRSIGQKVNLSILGIKDGFIEHGNIDEQLKQNGLTVDDLIKIANKSLKY